MESDFVEWFTLRNIDNFDHQQDAHLILSMQDYGISTVACWERTRSEYNHHFMKGLLEGNSFNGEAYPKCNTVTAFFVKHPNVERWLLFLRKTD